jgi:hydrogenase maturation factor
MRAGDVVESYEPHFDMSRKDALAEEFKHKKHGIERDLRAMEEAHAENLKSIKDASRRVLSLVNDLAKATSLEVGICLLCMVDCV